MPLSLDPNVNMDEIKQRDFKTGFAALNPQADKGD